MKAGTQMVLVAPAVLLILLLAGCLRDQPTAVPGYPSKVVRQYESACVPEVITEYTDSTETILVTFEGGYSGCVPGLARWGIDMADPLATDTPQGSMY